MSLRTNVGRAVGRVQWLAGRCGVLLAVLLAQSVGAVQFNLLQTIESPSIDLTRFGWSVDISGSTLVVGSPMYRFDDKVGEVHLFDALSGTWLRSLAHPAPALMDGFGRRVAISANTVLVSAVGAEVGGQPRAGTAYVFDADTGALRHALVDPATVAGGRFGLGVAINAGVAVIGAPWGGVDGRGTAHLFKVETGELLYSIAAPAGVAAFGYSVAMNGAHVAVGAPFTRSDTGSTHIFESATGTLVTRLAIADGDIGGYFGHWVALSDEHLAVAAPWDSTGAERSGSAYVFPANHALSPLVLTNPTPGVSDYFGGNFGKAIAVSGNIVVVGAESDDTLGTDSGAVYVFDAISGELLQTILNPNPARPQFGLFGRSVAIDKDVLVVGSVGYTDGGSAGAVYVYRLGDVDLTGGESATVEDRGAK